MEEKERYDVKRLSYSLNVKLTDNYEPDWRYIIFDDVNDAELDKLETVCNLLNQQDKELSKLRASYQQVKEENQQLKQQLAEKEKERELDNSFWKQECDSLQKTLEEKEKEVEFIKNMKADEMALKVIQKGNQDKISFAIAELEKVKSAFGLINSKLDKVETIKEYIHYIDHQIKQLKELR